MRRFDNLVKHLEREKRPPKNPQAVAAAIGRKKYGKREFDEMAEHGRKEQDVRERKPKGHKKGCRCVICRRHR